MARYEPIAYDISYLCLKDAENPNPVTYTVEDEIVFKALDDVWGWRFAGWSVDGIAPGSTGDRSVSAVWAEKRLSVAFYWTREEAVASGEAPSLRQVQQGAAVGELPVIARDGYSLAGWYGYDVARPALGTVEVTAGTEVRSDMVAFPEWTPNKYKVSFSASDDMEADDVQVNTFGEVICAVPTAVRSGYAFLGWYAGGRKYPDEVLAFNVLLANDGSKVEVRGSGGAVVSPVRGLGAGLSFRGCGQIGDLFRDVVLLDEFLPDGVSVVSTGAKWLVAGGAGKTSVENGEAADVRRSDNPSGLKLAYNAKTGAFRGSFAVYAIDSRSRLKKFSATVSGVVVDGLGYGVASINGRGSCAVTIAR